MRLACIALILGTGLADLRSQPASGKDIRVGGEEYTALGEGALSREFKLTWLNKEDLRLASPWATLVFKVGSRKAEINHQTVWLSFPIHGQNGHAYIARLDLRTLIQPVLYPAVPNRPVQLRTVALDAGHGGKDPGFQAGSQQEKRQTLLLAKEVGKQLAGAGLRVVFTRTTDSFVDLDQRPALAKRQHADVFVSLHFNSVASGKNGVRGIEVYCLTPAGASSTHADTEAIEHHPSPGNALDAQNILLAYQMQKLLLKCLPVDDRGLLRARYAVLRSAQMPAVLIEGGFMSDPEEARRIFSESYRRQLARAIADGVLAYKRLVERPSHRPETHHRTAPPQSPVAKGETIY